MTEIITLVANGMGHGAMKLMRTLLETSINTEYLRLCPSEYLDYQEWFWIEKYKEMVYIRENVPEIFKIFHPDKTKEIEDNRKRVLPRFETLKPDGTREQRRTWCSKSLAQRAQVTGHYDLYRRVNKDASEFIHGTMSALTRYHDAEQEMDRIAVPPSLDWTAEALSTSHVVMIQVVETVSRALNVPCDPSVEELLKDLNYAWEEIN